MKWIYSLMTISCVIKIISTDDWEVRCWAFNCLLWVFIAIKNDSNNNNNEKNQHSINY